MSVKNLIIEQASAAGQASLLASRTLDMLHRHGIDPIPSHYAVWYVYVSGSHKELIKEIDNMLRQSIPFTAQVNASLYEKFLSSKSEKILEHTTSNAKNLLMEVYKVISRFGQETATYNQEIDKQAEKLSGDFSGTDLEEIAREILQGATSMKQSGTALTQKLEASQQEIETLRHNLAAIATESKKDFLTGLANRKTLDMQLEEEIGLIMENGGELCLLMVDIDHFKHLNDRYGHLIGDEVLKIVAKCLIDSVRGKDMVARYGGEEFAVILPGTPIAGGMIVGETIRKTIASRQLKRKDTGQSYGELTVSVGVARFHGANDTIPALIQRADDALYRSKRMGRNRVTQEAV